MLKTILIIVVSVTLFGVLFFLYVKKSLKRRIDYLYENSKKD
ncbi:MAG: hypothetical protein FD545_000420 [Pelagibacterales bacterium]|nr:hypothetical protein [Pelagibacterales bacterium]